MSSRQDADEAEAGPSGLARHEMLTLLGLDISDSEKEEEEEETPSDRPLLCPEEMGDSEEDEVCQDVLDRFELQHQFQSNLLQ